MLNQAAPIARDRSLLPTLIALSMIGPLALNIFLPSLIHMEYALNTTYATVQLTISVFLATIAVATLAVGPLSDRYGRRPVALYGTLVFAIGSGLCLVAPTIEFLIAARVIQALGACVGLIIVRAIVRDVYDRDSSASMIGYVTMGMAVAPMVAPAIGGFLDTLFGWRSTFGLVMFFSLLVLFICFFKLPETNQHKSGSIPTRQLLESWKSVLMSKPFLLYAGAITSASCQYFAFIGGGAYICATFLNMTTTEYGLYFTIVAVGYICGNFLSGRYASRAGIYKMMLYGSLVSGLAIIAMTLLFVLGFDHPISLFGPMAIIAVGNGMMIPSASAGAVSVQPKLAGATSGIIGTLQVGTGALIGAIVGRLLVSIGEIEVFTVTLCICATLSLVLTRASRQY